MRKLVPCILLAVLTEFNPIALYSQNNPMDIKSAEKIILKDFRKIARLNPIRIIPFCINGKWGYMDTRTKRVLAGPSYRRLTFFSPDASGEFNDSVSFAYRSSDKKISFSYPLRNIVDEVMVANWDVMETKPDEGYPAPAASYNGFRGFRMDETGKITSFSSLYSRFNPSFFNISTPFRINGKWHAVAHKPDFSGVIDQDGNPLEGFDFNYRELVRLYETDDSLQWFYYVDKEGIRGFVSEKGVHKMHGQIFDYPLYSTNKFGYAIQAGREQGSSGLLDVAAKKWIIEPQSTQIFEICYTSTEHLSDENFSSRGKVKLWLLTREDNNVFYMNLEGKIYRPAQIKEPRKGRIEDPGSVMTEDPIEFQNSPGDGVISDQISSEPVKEEPPAIINVVEVAPTLIKESPVSIEKQSSSVVNEELKMQSMSNDGQKSHSVKLIPVQPSSGYDNINKLFREFPEILKEGTWKAIEDYCTKILPDEGTISFMKANGFSYRGLPEITDNLPLALDYIKTSYLNSVARFRANLETNNQLNDLTFIRVEDEGTEVYNRELGIEVTETFIILKSGNKEISCKLGEMFKINGVWKSFTEPKLGW